MLAIKDVHLTSTQMNERNYDTVPSQRGVRS